MPCRRSRIAGAATWPRPTARSMRPVVRKTGIPPRFARRIAEGEAAPEHAYDARLARGGGCTSTARAAWGKTELACRIAYDYRLAPRSPLRQLGVPSSPEGSRPKHGAPGSSSRPTSRAELRSTFDKGGDSEADVIRRYVNVPVLIIDDLGKDSSTQWVLAKLFQIVNGRYEGRARHDRDQPGTPRPASPRCCREYGRKEGAWRSSRAWPR